MEIETGRAVVYPWQCDVMGHLATQGYMRFFDDTTYHLLASLGYVLSDAARTQRGWADVSHHIEYRKEIVSGDLLIARSSVVRLGTKSFTYSTRLLRVPDEGTVCAVLTGVAVHFDLQRRVAIELPAEFRAAAARLGAQIMQSPSRPA